METTKELNLRTKSAPMAKIAVCGLMVMAAAFGQTGTGTGTGSVDNTADLTTLNNLLAAQNAQSAFYTAALKKFTAQDFAGINLSCNTNTPTYNLLQAIATQTGEQVTSLQAAITALGGTPVQPCTYNFPLTTAQNFLGQALLVSNAVSSAYVGLLGSVSSPTVRTNLATVAAVQARQSAYLDVLNASSPFPQAFEPTLTASDVAKALQAFTASCPGSGNGGGTGNSSVTAVAGPKTTTVTVSRSLTLDATGSAGPSGSALTYAWTVAPNSKSAAILNADTATPTVQFSQGYGVYTFNLTVTAANGSSAQDQISILYVGR